MTTTPPIVYSVGTLVEVDNTKTGYIIEIDDTNDDITRFKISYRVGNEIEVGVHQSRCGAHLGGGGVRTVGEYTDVSVSFEGTFESIDGDYVVDGVYSSSAFRGG